MGCANSRLDDLPAVALCRDRCRFVDEALRTTHSFAEAHLAYLDSLKSLAPTLSTFFSDHHRRLADAAAKSPPPPPPPPPPPSQPDSSSNSSESHLRFPPASDDEKDKSGFNLDDDETRRLIAHNFGCCGGGGLAPLKPPPSPPPASLGSAWDFLNLFETFEKYERLYRASNLEEDNLERAKSDGGEKRASKDGEATTCEVRVVEKSKDDGTTKKETCEKASRESTESGSAPIDDGSLGASEAMNEVQAQFVRASESGNEVLKLLYQCHRPIVNQDSFRLCFEEDFGLSSRNLSSSLKKLVLWEKKLYCEVKAEEKLRLIYQKKLQELKYLDREIAKSQKADSTRALLRDLTTKLKIAFQIVDRISIAINKLRDEELWPQIKELNQRLLPMWKTMLECHKSQYQKVAEAKGLDAISSSEKLCAADVKAAIQLKLELQTWNLSFSNWVLTHKDYIKSLNSWLTRCLFYEPEETPDGLIPFSPGRLGAPPIFVICNQWSQGIDRVSEKEVIGAIQGFVSHIDVLLKEHNVDMQQLVVTDKEIERKVKILERQEQKIQKAKGNDNIDVLSHSDVSRCIDLQHGMMQIFMAIEKFMANLIQVYEELRLRIEEIGEKPQEGLSGA